LWFICLANQTGVNLTEALTRNLAKKTRRDTTRHQENTKLHESTKQQKPNLPEKLL
jgi:NTP pyrophosphatase (non-canonical NTP hydrolase)